MTNPINQQNEHGLSLGCTPSVYGRTSMDFLKLIRSLEELLFEAMAWLIYYPRTMWMIVRHPLQMMDYADHEQRQIQEEPYADTLSPPLLLLSTILLTHALALAAARAIQFDEAAVTSKVFGSHQNLVLARSLCYAVLPLTAAYAYLRKKGLSLRRANLRPAFFGQCYLAAPYSLAVSVGALGIGGPQPNLAWIGGGIIMIATVLYLAVQTAQYRRCLGWGVPKATGLAVLVWFEAVFLVIALGGTAVALSTT